jgi:hypothetical protein
VISPKVPNWFSDLRSKAVLKIDSKSPKNSTSEVFPRYGSVEQIFLCPVGYYSEFCCAQWATAADLVMGYGQLRGKSRTV